MLTDLADVARSAGLRVVEEPGWRTRGHGEMKDDGPRTVTLHHTAGPVTGDTPSLAVVRDGRPDLGGPLAHYLIARSGTVHVIAAGLCWHTGRTREPWQNNAYAIGVECEHTGREDPWPPPQLDAMVRLCAALCDWYDVPHARVLGHKEIADPPGRKIDPISIDMRAFRAALATKDAAVPLSDTDVTRIAVAVWAHLIPNTFGDRVQTLQILNGVEQRVADLQHEVRQLRDEIAGLTGEIGEIRARL